MISFVGIHLPSEDIFLAITLDTIARNSGVDAITALANAGGAGKIEIRQTSGNVLLATITLSGTAFASASGGSAAINGTPLSDTAADNTGTANTWSLQNNAGTAILNGNTTTGSDSDLTLSTAAVNAAINAIAALCNGGDIQFTTTADTGFASVLATLPLNTTAFASASGGSAAIGTSPAVSNTVAAPGTIGRFRFRRSAGNSSAPVFQGLVGTSGSDINLNSTVVTVGVTLTINSFSLSLATTATGTGEMVLGSLSIAANQVVTLTSGSFSLP